MPAGRCAIAREARQVSGFHLSHQQAGPYQILRTPETLELVVNDSYCRCMSGQIVLDDCPPPACANVVRFPLTDHVSAIDVTASVSLRQHRLALVPPGVFGRRVAFMASTSYFYGVKPLFSWAAQTPLATAVMTDIVHARSLFPPAPAT
jgi:hypothetical protein